MIMGIAITYSQYLFDFVLFNLILLSSFKLRERKSSAKILWILAVIFCLYAYWGGDYIGYFIEFNTEMDESYRDPLYYYIKLISFGNYILFRFWVWGTALYLLNKIGQRFDVSKNLFFFVFTCCFLLLFSYARVSLGMCFYFLGFSYLVKPIKNKRKSWTYALILLILSYYGHRSLLPLIVLTPVFYMLIMTRLRLLLLFCLMPLFVYLFTAILGGFLNESIYLGEGLDGFSTAANMVANIDEYNINKNARLLKTIEHSGFFVSYFFCMWNLCWRKNNLFVPNYIKQIMTVATFIIIIASTFFIINTGATYIVAYRYLYMSAIPLIISLSYIYQNKIVKRKYLYIVLFISLFSAELTLFSTIY